MEYKCIKELQELNDAKKKADEIKEKYDAACDEVSRKKGKLVTALNEEFSHLIGKKVKLVKKRYGFISETIGYFNGFKHRENEVELDLSKIKKDGSPSQQHFMSYDTAVYDEIISITPIE